MALTAKQQKNLARLSNMQQSGGTLNATQQKNYLRLLGLGAGTNMGTANVPSAAPTIPTAAGLAGTPANMPYQALQPNTNMGTVGNLPSTMPNIPRATGLAGTVANMPATGGVMPPAGSLANQPAQISGPSNQPKQAGGVTFGPQKQANLARLQAMSQSGKALTPTQQQNLTRLEGLAAQAGTKKATAALQGPSSTQGLDFNIPASMRNFSAPSVSASNVSAGSPGMAKFDPGTLKDIAGKLGLDFGKLTQGLSAQDYLANQDPSYQFQQEQAQKAVQASAAARGGVLGGGTLKALQDRASQVAALDYQNAYARDLANRQLGLGQVQNEFGNEANAWGQNAGYDVSNRGIDLQAGIANQNAGLQAGMANASNAIAAQGLNNNMTQAQWDAQLSNRAQNLQQINDTFNRDLASKNFGLTGLQFAEQMKQNQFNNNMTGLGFAYNVLNNNQNNAMAGQNFGLGLLQNNQANQGQIANSWLNNNWMNQNFQANTLNNLLQSGYGASGTNANNAMNRSGQAGNAAAGYGNAAQAGAVGVGNAWANGLNGVNNAIQGGIGNALLLNYLGNKGSTGSGGGSGSGNFWSGNGSSMFPSLGYNFG